MNVASSGSDDRLEGWGDEEVVELVVADNLSFKS